MTRRFGLPLAIYLLAGAPALAAQAARINAPVAARIDSVFGRFTVPGSPGCALGVVKDGSLAYARGYGLASIELGVPITPATVFDIGSVSKQFTAMSVVLLAQDGKLSLDDEIQKWVPEVPRYARPVTLRHLLHHTSGIRDYIDVLSWSGVADESVTTDADALDAISRQKSPNFAPGEEFLYSNSGFFLLSVIVKRASGQSLRDFAAQRIFGPLGMTHTQFVDRHDMIVPAKAGSYTYREPGGFALALANWEQTGDGAVNTTVEDLVKWDRNFVTGEVGSVAGLTVLQTPGVLNGGKPVDYALGLRVNNYRGLRQVSHGGSWAGFRAQLTRFPEQQVSIFTLCNLASSGPGRLTNAVADILLAGRLGPQPPDPAPAVRIFVPPRPEPPPSGIAGRYHSDELLADWIVSVRSDSVIARAGLGAEFSLHADAPDTLSAFGTRITMTRTGDRITALTLNNRGLRDLTLTRMDP